MLSLLIYHEEKLTLESHQAEIWALKVHVSLAKEQEKIVARKNYLRKENPYVLYAGEDRDPVFYAKKHLNKSTCFKNDYFTQDCAKTLI